MAAFTEEPKKNNVLFNFNRLKNLARGEVWGGKNMY